VTHLRLSQRFLPFCVAALLLAACSASPSATSRTTSRSSGTTTSESTTTSSPTTTTTKSTTKTTTTTTTTTGPTTTTTTGIPAGWTEAGLLSQLIMVGASYSDPGASAQVVSDGAGGLVFFGEPAAGTGPTLTAQMQALARDARILPFMSTDEEGGGIARLANLVGALPWPRQMAEEWSTAEVTQQLATVGAAMKALGMNMDLAPVLDTAPATDTIDEENYRSFSVVGATAGAYGLAFLRGLTEGGIIPVVKHFPGLGHANGDTDTGPATDPPLSQLVTDDLIPFADAIAAHAPVVMMSNVTEPDWGSTPASMNPLAYEYLRNMGFTGVVITDSLDAGAISATGLDGAEACVKAIEAGADMGMITTPTDYPGAIAGLEQAVSSGQLSLAQVIKSVDRIVTLKDSILPAADAITPPQ
jgi:beta-N-acetylhexosaminidase